MGVTIRSHQVGWIVGVIILAAAVAPVAAQDITGAVQGTVLSPEGKPEPEVRITVSGPHLQGSRETTTNRDGFFQLLLLPPGRYTLNAARQGLQPLQVREIVVQLGRTTAVGPLTLATQPIELKPVEAVVQRFLLDPVHTTAGGVLDAKDYDALPVERDYKALIAILPQVNDSHRGDPLNVAGSTGLENQYYIDGVNVTDTRSADRATSLPYDFVRQVDVKTGGYEAQYGRALGALVNAITYSGTNDLEGNVFGFTQPGALAADPRVAPSVTEGASVVYDYGARVSGPVLRDRLWYSAALNPGVDQVEKEITGFGNYTDKTSILRFAGKLTWRASAATNVELSVLGDPTDQDAVNAPLSGVTTVLNPDPLLGRIQSGGVTTSLRATVAPSRSFLLQATAARLLSRNLEDPATAFGQSEQLVWDYVEGTTSGGYGHWNHDDRNRTSLTLHGTLLRGPHTIAGGVDYEDAEVVSSAYGDWIERLDVAAYLRHVEYYSGTAHNRSPAAFLQDSWRLGDRWTLNAGLRWSAQYLVGASGNTDQSITDEWQPRVGFSWQPGAIGAQRVFGSYGRYYQTLPANIPVLWFTDYHADWSYYSVDPRQPGATPDSAFDYTGLESDAPRVNDLHAENFDEFTVGYERLLGAQTRLTVRGMRRDLRSSYQWGIGASSSPVLGTPGQGTFDFLPAPKREYTALEISADGTWRKIRYRTSYVLSRSWGNYPGLFDSDLSYANPGSVTTFSTPNQAVNSTGYLPNDHTHVFKLSAASTTEFGLAAGAFLTFESGSPINEFAGSQFGTFYPSFLVQRGTGGRTPALWNLDLRLAYEVMRTRTPHLRVQLDVLHVGNPRGTTQVDELHYAAVDDNGNPTTPNANYRQPIAYQPPMAGRIGMQVGF